jgi:hypothetical protein
VQLVVRVLICAAGKEITHVYLLSKNQVRQQQTKQTFTEIGDKHQVYATPSDPIQPEHCWKL